MHLLESNQRIEPSFLTYIMPVPAGKSAPQNEHFLGFGMTNYLDLVYLVIFFASLSVSRSIRMSCTRTGPLTLRVMILPLSLPSIIRTRTCVISPVTPVRPMICMTSDGTASSAASLLLITECPV